MSDSTVDRGTDWKFELIKVLGHRAAPRVMSAAEFMNVVQTVRPGSAVSTARFVADLFVKGGVLHRVSNGLYLNRKAVPGVGLDEAACRLRAGAIISLHSVLGEAGVTNNPSGIVMAVLPVNQRIPPRLGSLTTSSGDRFHFYGLAERFFPQSDDDRFRMLQPGRMVETFRPEAALVQWLYLASVQRSTLTAPPVDIDPELLNWDLVDELAGHWSSRPIVDEWRSQAEAMHWGAEQDHAPSI